MNQTTFFVALVDALLLHFEPLLGFLIQEANALHHDPRMFHVPHKTELLSPGQFCTFRGVFKLPFYNFFSLLHVYLLHLDAQLLFDPLQVELHPL